MIQTVIANALRHEKSKPHKVKDFLPNWDRKPQDWREQLAVVRHLNLVYGGSVNREG